MYTRFELFLKREKEKKTHAGAVISKQIFLETISDQPNSELQDYKAKQFVQKGYHEKTDKKLRLKNDLARTVLINNVSFKRPDDAPSITDEEIKQALGIPDSDNLLLNALIDSYEQALSSFVSNALMKSDLTEMLEKKYRIERKKLFPNLTYNSAEKTFYLTIHYEGFSIIDYNSAKQDILETLGWATATWKMTTDRKGFELVDVKTADPVIYAVMSGVTFASQDKTFSQPIIRNYFAAKMTEKQKKDYPCAYQFLSERAQLDIPKMQQPITKANLEHSNAKMQAIEIIEQDIQRLKKSKPFFYSGNDIKILAYQALIQEIEKSPLNKSLYDVVREATGIPGNLGWGLNSTLEAIKNKLNPKKNVFKEEKYKAGARLTLGDVLRLRRGFGVFDTTSAKVLEQVLNLEPPNKAKKR